MSPTLSLLLIGGCSAIIGLVMAGIGWQQRKHHQLVTGTPTTEIRTIDSEGRVELQGTISGPAAGSGFVSPIGQTDETVFVAWKIEEWQPDDDEKRQNHNVPGSQRDHWQTIAAGFDAVPFHLEDGTDQIRVEIEDSSADVTREFEEVPVVEEVDIDSQPPAHLRTVEDEQGLSEPSGSIVNRIPVGNNNYGDRRYSERALTPGEEIYLLGDVRAVEGATTPLHPEDAVITPTGDETFLLSDLSEEELTQRIGFKYRFLFAASAFCLLLGIGLFVAAWVV